MTSQTIYKTSFYLSVLVCVAVAVLFRDGHLADQYAYALGTIAGSIAVMSGLLIHDQSDII